MVEFVKKLLALESKSLTIAELGARLQASTKTSWNKAFKSDYGPMDKFLRAHPSEFCVVKDRGDIHVSVETRKVAKLPTRRRASPPNDPSPSPSRPSQSPKKPRVSFAGSQKDRAEKKLSKLVSSSTEGAKESAQDASKKSKRKRKGANSNVASPTGFTITQFVLSLCILLALSMGYLLFSRDIMRFINRHR